MTVNCKIKEYTVLICVNTAVRHRLYTCRYCSTPPFIYMQSKFCSIPTLIYMQSKYCSTLSFIYMQSKYCSIPPFIYFRVNTAVHYRLYKCRIDTAVHYRLYNILFLDSKVVIIYKPLFSAIVVINTIVNQNCVHCTMYVHV